VDDATRSRLADEWLCDAQMEHASIAAFAKVSLDLARVGAPPELVQRVHQAALDEVRHARLCFGLASAYAGSPRSAGPLDVPLDASRAVETRSGLLARIAVQSAIDGCVHEAGAAYGIDRAARSAEDPVVRKILEGIANDEHAHAELAWDILVWCVKTGDRSVHAAVERAIAGHRVSPMRVVQHGVRLERYGRPIPGTGDGDALAQLRARWLGVTPSGAASIAGDEGVLPSRVVDLGHRRPRASS
jgi:hypothetical protein